VLSLPALVRASWPKALAKMKVLLPLPPMSVVVAITAVD